MNHLKGILYAALSSATFGLAPFFSFTLLLIGFSSFEVLAYRWGIATLFLTAVAVAGRRSFVLAFRDVPKVVGLSVLRAATSFSLIVAYRHIATGVASTIHFMYPLVVTLFMIFVFRERKSVRTFAAIGMSLAGVVLLSRGQLATSGGSMSLGLSAAFASVFSYAGYIVGVKKARVEHIDPMVFTCYVMGIGTLFYLVGAACTTGVRLVADASVWMLILGLALPATAISNITLVQAIKYAGPTLTSILGALEPLTAVIIGVLVFREAFTPGSAVGILLVLLAVALVVVRDKKRV